MTQQIAMAGTYIFSPHVLVDVNGGMTRQAIFAHSPDLGTNFGLDTLKIPGTNGPNYLQGGIPGFFISGLASMGNPSIYNPFIYNDTEYMANANLSWVKGSHSFRFGYRMERVDVNHWEDDWSFGPRGEFFFSGAITSLNGGPPPNAYNAWADWLLGQSNRMGKDSLHPQLSTTVRVLNQFFYARDIWQATRKLTVEYGVRFERYPYATTKSHGSVNYDAVTNTSSIGGIGGVPRNAYVNTGIGQLVPRVGVAYRVDDKTVVRAGFGLNSDPQNFWTELYIYPTIISASQVGANSYMPAGNLATGLAPAVFPDLRTGKIQPPTFVATDGNVTNYRVGYTESHNFTVQREVGKGFNAQLAYVGTHGVRLLADLNYNAAGPGQGVAGGAMYQKWGNPNPITQETPWQGGRYDALQTQLTRRVAGAQLGVIYTYSKAINWTDNEITTSPMWNWGPVMGRNRALASYDRTNNLQIWSICSLPFGRGQHYLTQGVGAAIFGGWELTPILEKTSGTPFTVSSSGASLNAPGNAQTADQVVSKVAILGGHGPNSPYFDPNAFAPVRAVRFGTSGRNILRGPGIFVLNLGLIRNLKLTESLKLQFRAEAYSLTNTPNYGNPGATVSNASFANGQLTSYGGYDIISSATGQRQIRFALKLMF